MNLDLPTWARLNAVVETAEIGPFKLTREEIRGALARAGAISMKVNRWRGGCRYTLHYLDNEGQIRWLVCEPRTIGLGLAPKRRKSGPHERRKQCRA